MIKRVTVQNYVGDTLTMELTRPEESGFVIKDITGIGPGKGTVNMTEIATSDGGLYNSARLDYRNIVLTLEFMGMPTIEDTRHLSYKFFPVKKKIILTFETDSRLSSIEGYVESNEPVIFSKKEYAKISVICPDPYFYSTFAQLTTFYGVDSLFEFPFSNESTVQDLIELGRLNNAIEKNLHYVGDAETGVTLKITAIGKVEDLEIWNKSTGERFKIDSAKFRKAMGSDIDIGDIITITTTKGKKSIDLYRRGKHFNILNTIDKNSDWFQLVKGDNIFTYTAEGISNVQFEIINKVVYEGV